MRWSAGSWSWRAGIDVPDREIELALVPFGIAAELAAAVSQYARELDIVLLKQQQHTAVEQIGRRDRRLAVVELGKARTICDGQPLVTTGCGYLPIGYLPTGYLPIGALPTGGAGGGGSLRGRSAAAAALSMAKDAAVTVRIFSIINPPLFGRVSGKAVNAAPVRRPADLCTSNLPELRC
jgi:hypothetical protein